MTSQRTIVGLFFLLLLIGVGLLFAQEPTPDQKPAEEMSISDVMQEAHKKPSQLLKRVATGDAEQQDMQRLRDLYEALAKSTPPKGSESSWEAKTELLVSAAQAALDGEEGASQKLFKAANCAACHGEHK